MVVLFGSVTTDDHGRSRETAIPPEASAVARERAVPIRPPQGGLGISHQRGQDLGALSSFLGEGVLKMRKRRGKWGDKRDQPDRTVWRGEDDVRRHPPGSGRQRGDDVTRIVPGKQGFADRPTEFMTGAGEEDARAVPVTRGGRDDTGTRAASGRGASPGDTVLIGRTQRAREPNVSRPLDDDPMSDPPLAGWSPSRARPKGWSPPWGWVETTSAAGSRTGCRLVSATSKSLT